MSVTPTLELQLDWGNALLDADGNAILDANDEALLDADWADALVDARSLVPIRVRRGTFGTSQKDRVGDVGTLNFGLDNSEKNSLETLSLYSPSNANARAGFGENTKIRLKISYDTSEKYKFQGIRLDLIDPESGEYGTRVTHVTAVDWFDEAISQKADGLSVETNLRDDQLLEVLLAVMENEPESSSFETGIDQYAVAFHDVRSESTTISAIFQNLMMSGLGTLFLNGSASTGEVLTYNSRHTLLTSDTPVATLDNSMLRLVAPRRGRSRVKKVTGVTHPARIDSNPTTKVYSLSNEISIKPGETITFSGLYIDPENKNQRITATDFVLPLVADTNYKFSSTSGSGNDMNADLSISPVTNGSDVEFTCTNNGSVLGYLWFLELYGKGVYLYDTINHVEQDTTIKKGQEMTFDMVYQDNFSVGKNITRKILDWESVEENERPTIHFKANRSAALMKAAIDVEPGSLVSIAETVTGINRLFFVNGVELEINHGGRDIDVYWTCAIAHETDYFWVLGVAGLSELGETTNPGF